MSTKTKFPREAALAVARELCRALEGAASRVVVAGSLRRRKSEVGDVEILYIPRRGAATPPGELMPAEDLDLAAVAIDALVHQGKLRRRLSKTGAEAWGPKNRLAVHVESGIPVDLFATSHESWFNYLVCRTGPAESNIAIAQAALARGATWNPYGPGFTAQGRNIPMQSEEEVFEFVGLTWREPWDRE